MGLNNLGLGFVFRAFDHASPTMRKIEGNFKQLDTTTEAAAGRLKASMAGLGIGLAAAATGVVGLALAAKAANTFGEFEEKIAVVGARSRATAEDMELLSNKALESSLISKFSPAEAAAGLENFAAVGFTVEEQMKALDPALNLAAGGMLSVSDATTTVSSAIKIFGKDAGDAGLVTDQLLRITNLTALGAGDLQQALANVSRGAGSAKASIEEMLPAMGLVKNTGVDASVAGTAVSSAFDFMAKNAKKIKKDFGVDVADAAGNFRDFNKIALEIFTEGNKKFGEVEFLEKITKDIGRFGKTAIVALGTQLTKGIRTSTGEVVKGAAAIDFMRKQMDEAAGAAKEMRDRMLDTFAGQKQLLGGALQGLITVIGKEFAFVFRPIVEFIRKAVTGLVTLIKGMPGPLKKAIAITFVFGAAILVVAGLVIAAAAAFVLLNAAVVAFGALIFPVVILLAKVALIAGVALAALIGVIVLVKHAFDKNLGGFADGVNEIFGKVKLLFEGIGQLMSGDGKLRGKVLQNLLDPANKGILRMIGLFQQARFRVTRFFEGFQLGFERAMEIADPAFAALKKGFMSIAKALGFGDEAMGLMTGSSWEFKDAGETIGELIGKFLVPAIHLFALGLELAALWIEKVRFEWKIWGPVMGVVLNLVLLMIEGVGELTSFMLGLNSEGEQTTSMWERMAKAITNPIGLLGDFIMQLESVQNLLSHIPGVDFKTSEGDASGGSKSSFLAKATRDADRMLGKIGIDAPAAAAKDKSKTRGREGTTGERTSEMVFAEMSEKMGELTEAMKTRNATGQRIILNVSGEKVGEAVARGQQSLGAGDWEIDTVGAT